MKIQKISDTNSYLVNRKPTICPNCGEKKVKKAILGYPTIMTSLIMKYIASAAYLIYQYVEIGVAIIVMPHSSKKLMR